MNKTQFLVWSLVGALSVLCASCSTIGPKTADVSPETDAVITQEEAAHVTEPEAGPKAMSQESGYVTKMQYLLQRETIRFSDNAIDEYIVYTYADSGTEPIRADRYDGGDSLSESILYGSREGNIQRRSVTDRLGNLVSYRIIEFDQKNNIISDASYNKNDELQSLSRYTYDGEGNKTKWAVYSGDGALLSYSIYSYAGGRLSKIESFSPSGVVEDLYLIEYDTDGHKVFERHYSGGKLTDYTQYLYQDGQCISEIYARGDGFVLRTVNFEYDPSGNIRRILHFDGGKTLREVIEREYISREVNLPKNQGAGRE